MHPAFWLSLMLSATPTPISGSSGDGDVAALQRAEQARVQGAFERAAILYAQLAEEGQSIATRANAELLAAQSFQQAGYAEAALYRYAGIIQAGPSRPQYLAALEGLATLSGQIDEEFVTGALLEKAYGPEFAHLPVDALNAANYLVGAVRYRKDALPEARPFLEAVSGSSPYYPKARYLLALIHVRRGENDAATALFREVASLPNGGLGPLATLGLARVAYGAGRYAESAAAYDAIPRYSPSWDEALAEGGWARLQNEDLGGSLGSLQALHAPQFAGSFQPESWILKATVFLQACLYPEARETLEEFQGLYGPMGARIGPLLEGKRTPQSYFELLTSESTPLPRPVREYLSENERLGKLRAAIARLGREELKVRGSPLLQGTPLGASLLRDLAASRELQVQLAGRFIQGRLADALQMIRDFQAQAELLRFEILKSEGELLSSGAESGRALDGQTLHRPRIPSAGWEYWKFDGEFWLDEIGYYRYTLKSGCAPTAEGGGKS